VINAQGKISPRGVGFGAQIQKELLLREGVEFSQADRISFRRFGWMDPY
jgi:alkylated DNA nucleotide flippase Atl1